MDYGLRRRLLKVHSKTLREIGAFLFSESDLKAKSFGRRRRLFEQQTQPAWCQDDDRVTLERTPRPGEARTQTRPTFVDREAPGRRLPKTPRHY